MIPGDGRFVGVDVGGTKILALVVSGGGEILARHKASTEIDGAPMADQIQAAIDGAPPQRLTATEMLRHRRGHARHG